MWTEAKLTGILSEPSEGLVEDMKRLEGDIIILGASGKMGPSLCGLAVAADKKAGKKRDIYAVARFGDREAKQYLEDIGVKTISCDLTDTDMLHSLPECSNVIYMAGKKFGTNGNEWQTWAMNAAVPAFVVDRFRKANYTVFSSGNVYPRSEKQSKGCDESVKPQPQGEYAMSCLARERAFEYAANYYGARVLLYRLNYAVDLRYGVLFDIASSILNKRPVSLATPSFNCVWQGYANEVALRGLLIGESPAKILNVTGPELLYTKAVANKLGDYLNCRPTFTGEGDTSLLSDSSECVSLFGKPSVSAETLIEWQAEWLINGGKTLDKPTHFEETGGKY